jgi:hypothetical protein
LSGGERELLTLMVKRIEDKGLSAATSFELLDKNADGSLSGFSNSLRVSLYLTHVSVRDKEGVSVAGDHPVAPRDGPHDAPSRQRQSPLPPPSHPQASRAAPSKAPSGSHSGPKPHKLPHGPNHDRLIPPPFGKEASRMEGPARSLSKIGPFLGGPVVRGLDVSSLSLPCGHGPSPLPP